MPVLIVEDHELLAQSLELALRVEGMTAQRVRGVDQSEVLSAAAQLQPALVLLDLDLGGRSGKELIEPLRAGGAVVLMLTGVTDRVRLAECIEAGAIGIVRKHQPLTHLVEVITNVVEGRSPLTRAQRDELLAELRRHRAEQRRRFAPFERLTTTEQAVLTALVEGHSAEAIATDRYVSITTVRSQIRSILRQLGVNSQLEAVAAARHAGWPGAERKAR
jgi:two-component system nitrate/nitrite response regulator NarL